MLERRTKNRRYKTLMKDWIRRTQYTDWWKYWHRQRTPKWTHKQMTQDTERGLLCGTEILNGIKEPRDFYKPLKGKLGLKALV